MANKSCGYNEPTVAASIWERIIDKETGEMIMSFSMLTINADGHEIMKHFHKPHDEKRSIVILDEAHYLHWLNANHFKAIELLQVSQPKVLISEPAPHMRKLI